MPEADSCSLKLGKLSLDLADRLGEGDYWCEANVKERHINKLQYRKHHL